MPSTKKIEKRSSTKRPRLGPYSRSLHRGALGETIDGRSAEGRFIRAYERMLLKSLGAAPSDLQRQLVIRASRLALLVELMDRRMIGGANQTLHDSNFHLAWQNALRRTLVALGTEQPTPPEKQAPAEVKRASPIEEITAAVLAEKAAAS